MKNKICFLFLFVIVNLAAKAQQDPQFSFYEQARLVYNPGYAGTSGAISGLILNRTQWSGLEGAPKSMVFSVESTTDLGGIKSGIGLNIIRDELGFEKNTLVNLNYAYLVQTDYGDLGIGASLGIFNKAIDGEWTVPDGEYWVLSDGYLPSGSVSEIALDFGFGLFLKSNNYFAGISVTHVNQAKISFSDDAYTFYTRHYYFSGGYTIQMPNPLFSLQPSVLYKTDLAGSQLDLNGDIIYNERFTGGIGYRLDDGLIFRFSVILNNGLKAGYAYDLTTSALGAYSSGSHELFLSYSFAVQKSRNKKYKSVRYL
ncbi:PorP/SprF family type IX secretion system membrane protein [Mangrovibacterium diazotrophicum]|uniref:Type IX secretion system PorP/SprF family membrane protein n=1 Tax=Mangrovibacterium diazotrophicum TaxID=1261403 RepID=A0A419W918_9BACT|nr:type IX secretion system membrane protein PorP/SprF [Mangrovibacterium diazotrophicum]RKD91961.1 type IX secretion system PorP/SprF family membrane protein [Mangrovibacterium diazotrophicum]